MAVTTVAVATHLQMPATPVVFPSLQELLLLLFFRMFGPNIIIYDLSSYFAMKNEPNEMAIVAYVFAVAITFTMSKFAL